MASTIKYKFIVHPETGKKININNKHGRKVIEYYTRLQLFPTTQILETKKGKMYKFITNPDTGRVVNIWRPTGIKILNNYRDILALDNKD